MNNHIDFRNYLKTLKIDENLINKTIELSEDFIRFSKKYQDKQEDFDDVKDFCNQKISGNDDALEQIIALARYCKFSGNEAGLIYLITLTNTLGVIESIAERLEQIAGTEIMKKVFSDLKFPSLGTSINDYPKSIKQLLKNLDDNLSEETYCKVLAGNHHKIPAENFDQDKIKFKELGSIDEFLKYRHEKTVEQMEKCLKENKLWFEQKITPRVIKYFRDNPEIQTGVRKDNKIYLRKIPYMVDDYLQETDPLQKRYLACHCPFVRASIKNKNSEISKLWCYCTAGFQKVIFDTIYERDLEIELLESVLAGDEYCRFAITLPETDE